MARELKVVVRDLLIAQEKLEWMLDAQGLFHSHNELDVVKKLHNELKNDHGIWIEWKETGLSEPKVNKAFPDPLLECAECLKDIVNATPPYSPDELLKIADPILGAVYESGIRLGGEE